MSSHRPTMPCDAVIVRQDRPVGAMLLPIVDSESFVEEFNRTYASIGLRISVTGQVFTQREFST
ncbi:hypothetical protein [Neorhodopirellula pilleata]|uniref:Uncharacterized protein n=1 Tax=Neorhodopirellula pilleata TaxID=2714738 RepID=A0A5C6A1Y3_9BACT|nr:hypothetical protein [Neorhodopirellula pilleata]TWT93559.1 hypothetical protein Pla100_40770 [Neorhodopirellula pilleata]